MKFNTVNHSAPSGRETDALIHPLPVGEPLVPSLFDGLPGLAYFGHPDRDRTLEHLSASGRELLGLKAATGPVALASFIHPDDRELVLGVIATAVAQHRPFAIEYRLRHTRGAWLTVWEQGRPVGHGQHTAVQGYIQDVSPRLQREQARLKAEHQILQAQKINALNQLAAGVAHEFNNLIAGILGSAELIAMDLPATNPGHESLKQIFEASNRARDFVHKLRALGQRRPLERKPIRLQPVIEDCVQILRSIIPAKVEIHPHLEADCPPVQADQAQLHQAILDLCLQSWQGLTERRGCIKINLENCSLGLPAPAVPGRLRTGPHVRLTVRDNGPGLDPSAREKIFDPFQARRAGEKKMGLELFLVRETVQAHQGEIFVESEPGKGLAFHLYLPVADEA